MVFQGASGPLYLAVMAVAEGMGLYGPIGAFPLFGPQDPCPDLAEYLQFLVPGMQVCVFVLELLEPI
jgi:hypothetical protein